MFTEALLRNSRYALLVGSLPGNASSYTLHYRDMGKTSLIPLHDETEQNRNVIKNMKDTGFVNANFHQKIG
jgi:hypothetical protein